VAYNSSMEPTLEQVIQDELDQVTNERDALQAAADGESLTLLRALAERDQQKKLVRELQHEVAALSVERDSLRSNNAALCEEMTGLRQSRNTWSQHAEHWRSAAANAQVERDRLRSECDTLQRELEAARVRMNRAHGDCTALQFHIDTLRTTLETYNRQFEAMAAQPRLQKISREAIAALEDTPNPRILMCQPRMVAMLFYIKKQRQWIGTSGHAVEPKDGWFINMNTIPASEQQE